MIRVLFIVPYEGLEPLFEEELSHCKIPGVEFSLTQIYGTDEHDIDKAGDYDIVVARGMTGYAISRRFPDLTTIQIIMTGSDVLDALASVKKKFGLEKTAILLPDISIISEETLSELTGFETVVQEIRDEVDLPAITAELWKKGCRVFVGGITLHRFCEEAGLDSVGILTGMGTIRQSIQDALNAARILMKERERQALLKVVLDNSPFAILAVDSDGAVLDVNQEAEAFFSSDALKGRKASELIPEECLKWPDGKIVRGESVHAVGSQMALVTRIPISLTGHDGCLVILQKVNDIYATEKKIRSQLSSKGLTARYHFWDIVAESLVMKQLLAKAVRYAQVEGNVLLTGETGTGKELFVQSMHNASPRSDGPFVAINCATLSEQLLESELFGYAEGAFTGASRGGKAGLFELAHGGTIFLDEIGEMPIALQSRLLRVLQEGEIRRVGGDEFIPVDVRVMSATNKDIPSLIEEGLFRRDLYYRINLLSIHIPPLRERGNDVDLLFSHFINYYSKQMGKVAPVVDQSVRDVLHEYIWPGNIRELRNAAQRIVILGEHGRITGDTLRSVDLPEERQDDEAGLISHTNIRNIDGRTLYEEYTASGMSLSEFARARGISRTTLWRRLKEL